jgi:hypothetical protein
LKYICYREEFSVEKCIHTTRLLCGGSSLHFKKKITRLLLLRCAVVWCCVVLCRVSLLLRRFFSFFLSNFCVLTVVSRVQQLWSLTKCMAVPLCCGVLHDEALGAIRFSSYNFVVYGLADCIHSALAVSFPIRNYSSFIGYRGNEHISLFSISASSLQHHNGTEDHHRDIPIYQRMCVYSS